MSREEMMGRLNMIGLVLGLAVWAGCIDPGSGGAVEEPSPDLSVADMQPDLSADPGDAAPDLSPDMEPDAGVAGCAADSDCASALPNVVATCGAGGRCEVACAQGFAVAPGATVEQAGCACEPADEVCDGADNDCDGMIDEGFSELGQACEDGVGECEGAGTYVCAPDGMGVVCQAAGSQPTEEICGDGKDNDCDGETDEGFEDVGTPCSVGMGICARGGTVVCSADGRAQVCNAVAGTPNPDQVAGETFCDGQDNDCDGQPDEGCDDDGDDYCDKAMTVLATPAVCPKGGQDCDDTAADVYPGAPGKCDGKDNDCDGQVDDYKVSPDTALHKSATLTGNATMTDATYLNPTVMAAPMANGFCVGSIDSAGSSVALKINRVNYDGTVASTCSKTITRRSGDTGDLLYRIFDMKTEGNGCAMVVGYSGSARPSHAASTTKLGYDFFHHNTAQPCVSSSSFEPVVGLEYAVESGAASPPYNQVTPSAAIGRYYGPGFRATVGYTSFRYSDGVLRLFSTKSWSEGVAFNAEVPHNVIPFNYELMGYGDLVGNSYFMIRSASSNAIVHRISATGVRSVVGDDFYVLPGGRYKTFFMDSTLQKAYLFSGSAYDNISGGLEYNLLNNGMALKVFEVSSGGSTLGGARYAGRHLVAPPLTGRQELWGISPNKNVLQRIGWLNGGPAAGTHAVPGNPPHLLTLTTSPGDKGYLLAMTSPSPLAVKVFPFTCH